MAIEIALAVVVLSAAGLMIKSVSRLIAVDPGLTTSHVLTMDIALPQPDTYGPPVRTTFCSDVQREVASLPGVTSVSAISHLPLSGANAGRGFTIEGRPAPAPNEGAGAAYRLTCPGYFRTLGITMIRGRDFTDGDSTIAPGAVILNEATASRYWPNEDPLGQRLKLGGITSASPWLTVVGIARDVRPRQRGETGDVQTLQPGCVADYDCDRQGGRRASVDRRVGAECAGADRR